jgi:hypothetical protein
VHDHNTHQSDIPRLIGFTSSTFRNSSLGMKPFVWVETNNPEEEAGSEGETSSPEEEAGPEGETSSPEEEARIILTTVSNQCLSVILYKVGIRKAW